MILSTSHARTVGLITLSLSPLLPALTPSAQATTILGPEMRFKPDSGQPIFPAGNINVFKQFVLDWNERETVGGSTSIWLLGSFGGSVTAGMDMAFGLEMGLCFGGNANFDLGFRPSITLPDRYPTEVPIPLTVAAGLLPNSKFTTTFPPLGKAYADMIFHMEADLEAEACVFGCADFEFDFSTCDIPPLVPGGDKLFKKSVRCDPSLTARQYCALELASFNREDDNCVKILNVGARNFRDFLYEPYKEYCPSLGTKKTFTANAATDRITLSGSFAPFYGGAPVKVSTAGELPAPLNKSTTYYIIFPEGSTCKLATRQGSSTAVDLATSGAATHTIELHEANPPDNPLDGRYGSVNIAVPTVETDSTGSPFNTCEILKSTGAEDIFAAKLDVAALVSDFILPPEPFPRLSDSGSVGPLSWDYTLASLDLGPAVKLQTDFEMTWDLLVKDITFTVPGSGAPGTPRDVNIKGQRVNKLSQVLPARTYHLTNCGPFAMPPVSLITAPAGSAEQLPVQVTITYEIRPKLKTVVSTPFYGLLEYEALAAHISLDYVGGLGFGPLIEGDHKFKFGEFTVYNGNPSPISAGTGQVGTITFPMQASGPPSFAWRPSQLSATNYDWSQSVASQNGRTNWLELVSEFINAFPGMNGGTSADVQVGGIFADPEDSKFPILTDSRTIASLQIQAPSGLNIQQKAPGPGSAEVELTVGGGLLENSGFIQASGFTGSAALRLNGKDSVLCGTGVLALNCNGVLRGYTGPEPFTFSNYNTIQGDGPAMDVWEPGKLSTINNMGTFSANADAAACVILTLDFDRFPGETSWEIRNAANVVVATSNGRTYGSRPINSRLVQTLRLPAAGNYTLRVSDFGSNGMCCNSGNGAYSLRNINNAVLANGAMFGAIDIKPFTITETSSTYGRMDTSAVTVINQNVFEARQHADGTLYGQRLDTRAGSRISASGEMSRYYLSFHEAEHAGLILAENGGFVRAGPSWGLGPRATWNAGQSFTNDVGFFRASGLNSELQLDSLDMTGGCFALSQGGAMSAEESNFTGSVFHIGDFNPDAINEASGFLTLSGINRTYTGTCLSNYGTVTVAGQADFVDNVMFSNNGKIAVTAGGSLRIRQKTIAGASDAAPETKTQPGAANASAATLIGGIWDVAGALLIDGAAFTGIGANAAGASTTRGAVDGTGAVTGAPENDKSRVLSLGDPGKVTLRGANWSFPALATLAENRGRLCLVEGAVFPRTPVNTPGSLTNKGAIRIEAGSRVNVGGAFIQKGARSTTDIISGALVSSTKNFQIIGGRVTATADSNFFNRSGTTIPAGTTIRVESPLIDTNEVDIFGNPTFIQERVTVNLGAGVQIVSIAAGADVTVHGGAVDFEALESYLRSNAGTFTLSGDNIDNSGVLDLGFSRDIFTNTGRVNVLGGTTKLLADYVQNGAAAVTHIGGGAALKGNVTINAGQIILDIAGRPSSNRHAIINAGTINLGNNLVIDFNGELGTPAARLDVGDTWEIVPRTTSAVLTVGTPTYKWNGGALPAGFLPAGTHLETIRFNTESGLRGFGIRVVPNGGFLTYDAWATSKGMPANYRRDPYYDADSNGRTNAQEFLFGAVAPAAGSVREVTGTDGKIYREFIYTRAAGNHDARFAPYASTDKVNWYKAPMVVRSVTPVAGTAMEQVVLRSPFPATGEKVYYRIQADLNPDNFADNSGLIPGKPIGRDFNALNGRGHVAGEVLFFNINTPNSSFDSIWGTNATGYGDWSSLPTACIHAGLLPAGSHGLAKVTFFPKLASYTGAPANGVTPQAPGNYPGTNDPAGVSYRVALSSESGPVDSVNFVSNNASLASLETSAGTLTPVFASGTISYSVNVPNAVTSVTLTPTLADGTASMRLNGVLPVASGVATSPLPVNPGTTVFTVNVTAQDTTTTKTYSLSVTRLASDFTVTTTGNAIVVTDVAGFSDTLEITQPTAGNILFTAAGRTFKVNGGPVLTGSSGNLSRTGITSIAVNTGDGFDTINVDAFTGTLPALTLNGGSGNDTVNLNGDLTFAANASLNLDLQNDSAEPGDDSITLDANANILTSGTGSITVKVSQAARLAAGASLETVNGGITVEAGHPSTAQDDLYGILLEGGAIRSTGTGTLTLTADSMMLAGPVSAGAASSVSLRQKSNTTAINLGSADFVDTLGLTDAELDQISAANITIGDALTPMITISAPVSRAASTALTLVADPAAGSIIPAAPGTDLNLAGGTLTIGGPGSTLAMGITGLTPDTQFTQLKVAGGVNLTGSRLFLNSTFAGTAGNVFTVVDNDGADAITGTFAGLPAASEIAWPGSATLLARISYTGGTGNDVTLTLVPLVTNDLIARGASWKYLAPLTAAAAPALTWRNPGFAETDWLTGNAEIGYGDADEATLIPTASGRPFTVYFRKTFTVANPASFSALTLSLVRDDGAVVYLNGVEVWRTNMLELIPVTYATPASATAGSSAEEQTFYTRLLEPGLLVAGTNVLAVEVHQVGAASSDISFNAGLVASPGNPDTDGDGLPDAWENANFGNLTATAAGDTDGDGRSNLSEWKARTNPLDSRDAFVITSATANASRQTTLTWPTVPGVNYRVQRSTTTSGWANIGSVLTGTGSAMALTDSAPPAGAPRLIYRVVIP